MLNTLIDIVFVTLIGIGILAVGVVFFFLNEKTGIIDKLLQKMGVEVNE